MAKAQVLISVGDIERGVVAEAPVRLVPVGVEIQKALAMRPLEHAETNALAGEIWLRRGGGISTPHQQDRDWFDAEAMLTFQRVSLVKQL